MQYSPTCIDTHYPNQKAALNARGISAACVNGEIKMDPVLETRVLNGEFRLLFIGPESLLQNPLWREMVRIPVYRTRLVAIAINEAHCITKW